MNPTPRGIRRFSLMKAVFVQNPAVEGRPASLTVTRTANSLFLRPRGRNSRAPSHAVVLNSRFTGKSIICISCRKARLGRGIRFVPSVYRTGIVPAMGGVDNAAFNTPDANGTAALLSTSITRLDFLAFRKPPQAICQCYFPIKFRLVCGPYILGLRPTEIHCAPESKTHEPSISHPSHHALQRPCCGDAEYRHNPRG